MNDGIDTNEFAMTYIKVDENMSMVSKFEKEALLAKFDMEAAYRNITVHPVNHFLPGLKWRGTLLIWPYPSASAQLHLSSAQWLTWWSGCCSILMTSLDLLHYLDDFITAGPPRLRSVR